MDLMYTASLERTNSQSVSYKAIQARNQDKKDPFKLEEENTFTSIEKSVNAENTPKRTSLWKVTEDAEKQRVIDQLRSIDAEVRAHEMSHLAAAGQFASGGPRYVYVTGPDGKQYAVGGEISISLSGVSGNLDATIQKARAIRNAALAVGDPSSADLAVAAAATQMEMAALAALARQRMEKMQTAGEQGEGTEPGQILSYPQAYVSSSQMKLHDAEPIVDMYA